MNSWPGEPAWGEQRALTALAEVGSRLGYAVAVLVNLLNPAVILLGGYYAPLAPWLLPAVERECRPLTIAPDAGGLQLAASTLGYEVAALGGATVALDAMDPAGMAVAQSPCRLGAGTV